MVTRFQGDIHTSNDPEFESTVQKIIADSNIEDIVETGTYDGTGSTMVWARTGLPVNTIECNPQSYVKAVNNLNLNKNVTVHNAYSLLLLDMLEWVDKDDIYSSDRDVMADGDDNPKAFYKAELGNYMIPEEKLLELIRNDRRQIIFLDSAGGVGYLEYGQVMEELENGHMSKNKILILDDINHVKHCRSVEDLKNKGYDVHVSSNKRWAWVDLSRKI